MYPRTEIIERDMTEKEIKDLFDSESVESVYIKKGVGDKIRVRIEKLTDEEIRLRKTEWKVDIWDCHGILKKAEWGLGYGSKPDLKNGEWIDIGWFSVPVKHNKKLTEKEKERAGKVIGKIVDKRGMINMSGFYPVTDEDFVEIKKILKDKILE